MTRRASDLCRGSVKALTVSAAAAIATAADGLVRPVQLGLS